MIKIELDFLQVLEDVKFQFIHGHSVLVFLLPIYFESVEVTLPRHGLILNNFLNYAQRREFYLLM